MRILLRGVLPALAAALFLCGCASSRLAESVEVTLVNLRFEQMTPFETTAHFTIRVQNQTPEALGLEGGVHKIYLNQVYVGSGVNNEMLDVPRLSEGIQNVTVHIRNLAMLRLVREIVEAKRVDYRLDSLVYARCAGRASKFRVSKAGAIDVKDYMPSPTASGTIKLQ